MPKRKATQGTVPKALTNRQIAALLERIGDILELNGENVFKIRAYRAAADSVEHLNQDIRDIWLGDEKNLLAIQGVGAAIASKLDELLRTGEMSYYNEVAQTIPIGVLEIMKVPDVGPKTTLRLWKELNVTSIEELRAAIDAGKVRELKGLGAK